MLGIHVRLDGVDPILEVNGKVNFEVTAQLRDELKSTLDKHQSKMIIMDCTGITFIDSSGLGLMVAAKNSLDKINGKFAIVGLTPNVKKVFQQTNLFNYFKIFNTVDEALAGLRGV